MHQCSECSVVGLSGGRRRRLLRAFAAVTRVELLKNIVRNTFEHLAWECSKQLPADVERIGDRAILVGTCKATRAFDESRGRMSDVPCVRKFFSNLPRNSR